MRRTAVMHMGSHSVCKGVIISPAVLSTTPPDAGSRSPLRLPQSCDTDESCGSMGGDRAECFDLAKPEAELAMQVAMLTVRVGLLEHLLHSAPRLTPVWVNTNGVIIAADECMQALAHDDLQGPSEEGKIPTVFGGGGGVGATGGGKGSAEGCPLASPRPPPSGPPPQRVQPPPPQRQLQLQQRQLDPGVQISRKAPEGRSFAQACGEVLECLISAEGELFKK